MVLHSRLDPSHSPWNAQLRDKLYIHLDNSDQWFIAVNYKPLRNGMFFDRFWMWKICRKLQRYRKKSVTVLGPVLFILFIYDIGVICSGSVTHKLLADDMKLYSTIDTNLDRCSLQSALDRLHLWCCNWQLSVNVGQCHVLHIGKTNHHYSYFLMDVKLMTPVLCCIWSWNKNWLIFKIWCTHKYDSWQGLL